MQALPDLLGDLLRQAFSSLPGAPQVDGPLVLATQDPTFGDYQSNAAFRLTRALRQPPLRIAQALVEALPEHPMLAGAEVAKPGFVNFRLRQEWLTQALLARMEDPHLGLVQDGRGQRVVVDYGSPNVAKRMHVGHLRSTNIGAALVAMLRASGAEVIGDNHLGDWGTQFGKLLVAWDEWNDPQAFEADAIGQLQRLYVRFQRESEGDPELQERARRATARLQAGHEPSLRRWKRFVQASMEEFEGLYRRMGVQFDEALGESHYQPMLGPLVEELLERGIAEEDDGAVLVRFAASDGKGLAKTPLLIRKRDGAALYATTDLAALRYRERTWNPDRVLYVTDMRQQLHFRQVFAAAARAGLCDASLEHVWFGMLSLPEGAMATRKGNVIRLRDLMDEAARRARRVVDEKSPQLSEQERERIAEAVGVSAVRYADLSQNPQSNIVFDWDRMLALEGNTAPFLMYSYARARSIQRKAGEQADLRQLALGEPSARELALGLLRFSEALRTSLAASRPNMFCDYLFALAGSFNRFYYQVPVLKAEPEQRRARLALVEAAARVLRSSLVMVGITPLERM